MNVHDLKGERMAFAASGGLDSCTIVHWLSANGVKVVCMTADLGQPDETSFDEIGKRMLASGADAFVGMPLQETLSEIGLAVVQAQACYEGRYWNTTGAGRQAIVQGLVRRMRKHGLSIMSHGSTGRGNDQVRFQIGANLLDPDLKVYAPWRDPAFLERFSGRQQMIDYCEQHGIPIKATRDKPYSTDANLLGLTHEGGALERLGTPADFVTPAMGVWPEQAPERAEIVELRFENGRPTAVNDERLSLPLLFRRLNAVAGRHGVGIGHHMVENRFVGVKSRGVYEAPGMELLGTAYALLSQIVLDRRATELLTTLSGTLARQLYQGYWADLASQMARAAIAHTAALMSGTLRVSLYRGTIRFVSGVDIPHSLFTADGSMEAEGSFDHADSEGLLRILSLNARTLARAGQIADHDAGG
ncbi:MAG: argininosuccinate synthase [Reyranella sp.]|uniref:argininosuccinate synthase n=1 Tax=Reyranella sp. TaxID=1929291 RepID=UPI0011FCEDE2|nr:argininosuccinate synthase [Reyranella sp.]TAJ87783.1 MAG: argininosuccinate synthase [Reyranella sp.]TBR30619.1 MAG: argininosuccinate synthase [Reyranella sp.]